MAQKAVIKKDDLFLILLRAKDEKAFPGLWDFPGGRLEVDEDQIIGLKREVEEETKLTVEVGDILGTYHSQLQDKEVKFVIYDIKSYSGYLEIGHEHSEFRWLRAEEILHLPVMPYMEKFLNDLRLNE